MSSDLLVQGIREGEYFVITGKTYHCRQFLSKLGFKFVVRDGRKGWYKPIESLQKNEDLHWIVDECQDLLNKIRAMNLKAQELRNTRPKILKKNKRGKGPSLTHDTIKYQIRWRKYHFLECVASLPPKLWYGAHGKKMDNTELNQAHARLQKFVRGMECRIWETKTTEQFHLHDQNGLCERCGKNVMSSMEMDYLDRIRSDQMREIQKWPIIYSKEELLRKLQELGFQYMQQCIYCHHAFEEPSSTRK